MSPDDWRVLYEGRIVAASSNELQVELPRLKRRTAIRLHGLQQLEWRPSTHTWEDADIADLDAIASAGLTIEGVRWSNAGTKVVVLVSDGTLLASYERAETDPDLVDAWRLHWSQQSFPDEVHDLVRAALDGAVPDHDAVLEAWRDERTGDLAALLTVLESPSAVESARELARCATLTFDVWSDADEAAARWARLTNDVAETSADPDPRIGYALLASLYSPSDWWFRVDQVAHIAGPFRARRRRSELCRSSLPTAPGSRGRRNARSCARSA